MKKTNTARAIRRTLTSGILRSAKRSFNPKQMVAGYVGDVGGYASRPQALLGAFLGDLRPEMQTRSMLKSVLEGD